MSVVVSSCPPPLQGTSSRMEDRVLALDLSRHPHFAACQRAVLMAVLDGHAGSAAAAYLEVRGRDGLRSTNVGRPDPGSPRVPRTPHLPYLAPCTAHCR